MSSAARKATVAPSAESALAAVDERMPVELVAHGRPDRAGAAAVDDAHLGEPGERGVVDERAHGLARLLRARAADVELVGDVAARAREHRHRRLGRVARTVGLRVGLQAGERDADALAAAADHLRLVAVDLRDRAAQAERRSRDGIADGERALSAAAARAARAAPPRSAPHASTRR